MPPVAISTRSRLLHGAGLVVLALAWFAGHALVGFGHAGHEPAVAYLLALLAFPMASAGAALTVMGPRLFDRVVVADRWSPHVPATFHEPQPEDRA